MRSFLEDLGYYQSLEKQYLTQACAQFWFANGLGSQMVFPYQLQTLAVEELMARSSSQSSWVPYSGQMAFFVASCRLAVEKQATVADLGERTCQNNSQGWRAIHVGRLI